MAVSDVRIMPVEYSDVMFSAPSTTITSWLRMRPARLVAVASKFSRSPGDTWFQCEAVPQLKSAPRPTVTTITASSVQYVDLTERSLVNSERSAAARPTRPRGAGRAAGRMAGAVVVVMSAPVRFAGRQHACGRCAVTKQALALLARHARVVFDAVRGKFHERLLQRRRRRGKLVQPDAVVEGQIADLLRRDAPRDKRAVRRRPGPPARVRDQLGQHVRLRGADAHGLLGTAVDEILHATVPDQPAAADHDEVTGLVLHLRHQVTAH